MVGGTIVVVAVIIVVVVVVVFFFFILMIAYASSCAAIKNKGTYVVTRRHRSVGRTVGHESILEGGMKRRETRVLTHAAGRNGYGLGDGRCGWGRRTTVGCLGQRLVGDLV